MMIAEVIRGAVAKLQNRDAYVEGRLVELDDIESVLLFVADEFEQAETKRQAEHPL